MTEALHCIYCSARLRVGATRCSSCGSEVARGHAQPIPNGARCPRCKARNAAGQLTRRNVTLEASVLECNSCGGVMVEPRDWGAIVDAVERGDRRFDLVGAPPGSPLSIADLLPLLTCPGCARELDRVAFAGKSRISVDICNVHGIWLDGGELGKVLGIVRYKSENHGAMPAAGDGTDNAGLTAEQRREKVLASMGIADPQYDSHLAPIRIRSSFDANRLAGRVAFVAGGLEGAAAYGVLRAVAHGAGSAFEFALARSSTDEAREPAPPRSGFQLPDLRCLFCGATHRESDDACAICRSPITRVVCTSCRSPVAAGEERCRCGAPLLPDAQHEQMACPRCKSELDRTELDANTVAHRCSRCLGSFFGIRDWTVVLDAAAVGRPLPLAGFVALPPGREVPRAVLEAGAACPRCRKAMERITFAMRSNVVVDICSSHGMWLDAGELIALCNFINRGPSQ